MRGLTLYQPWASLIAIGVKTIESRSWTTDYRGPLCIHAARKWDGGVEHDCLHAMAALAREKWPESPAGLLSWRQTLGKILCVVRLVRCERSAGEAGYRPLDVEFGDLSPGRAAWRLCDVRPLVPPVPCGGARGLWSLPADVERAVRAQLGGPTVLAPPPPAQPGLFDWKE